MALTVHRSQRVERLADFLAERLQATWPDDPFARVPIVVGSRGMEQWLRGELATRHGIAARLDFPFPRQALDGAVRALALEKGERLPCFWEAQEADAWQTGALVWGVLGAVRARAADPALAPWRAWLDGQPDAVGAREYAAAYVVADVLERVLRHRPALAADWRAGREQGGDRWLATLLRDLEAAVPARHVTRVAEGLRGAGTARPEGRLHVFGLSTIGRADLELIEQIARFVDVELYLFAPSRAFFADMRTRRELLRQVPADADGAVVEEAIATSNELLAGLGRPSRELQWLLERSAGGYSAGLDDEGWAAPAPTTLLEALQAELLDGGATDGVGDLSAFAPGDASLVFHRSHGALRQAEVVRDALLAHFAADETLEPRDVLVMTPDVDRYGPIVQAVFMRTGTDDRGNALPAIPVVVADRAARGLNPVADVLLRLLELARGRITAVAVDELLHIPIVAARAGLGDVAPGTVTALLNRAGAAWGLDASDHRVDDRPPTPANTLAAALTRLALGVVADPGVEPIGGLEAFAAIAPARGDEEAALGAIHLLASAIGRHVEALRAPACASTWGDRLRSALADVVRLPDETAWQLAAVHDAVAELAERVSPDLVLDASAVALHVEDRLRLRQRGDRPPSGAVTVCALEPMRSVPFRVIVLVGLDHDAWPRADVRPAWDPVASAPRTGDPDRRAADRHLLLEALLSARDALHIVWAGVDDEKGDALPPATPVAELLELLERRLGVSKGALVRREALQPWSGSVFDPASPRSFDAAWRAGAEQVVGLRRGGVEPAPAAIVARGAWSAPLEGLKAPASVDADELARDLLEPASRLLRRGLRVQAGTTLTQAAESEPLELDQLEKWSARDAALGVAGAWLLEGRDVDADVLAAELRRRYAADGSLPLLPAAWDELDRAAAVGGGMAAEARRLGPVARWTGSAAVGDVTVRAAALVAGDTALIAEASSGRWRGAVLRAWATLLVAAQHPDGPRRAVTVCHRSGGLNVNELALPADVIANPAPVLAALVERWKEARTRVLPIGRDAPNKGDKKILGDVSAPALAERAHGEMNLHDGRPKLPPALLADLDGDEIVDLFEQIGLPAWVEAVWAPVAAALATTDGEEGEP
jgi:exodeoxyribonuclease V gamma subunit